MKQDITYFVNEGGIIKNKTSIRCYNKKDLPADIAKKYNETQISSKEGFQPNSTISYEDIIETPESIDISMIALIALISYGTYWFMKEVSTLKK